MSWLKPKTILVAGGSLGAAVLLWPRSNKSLNSNVFNTPASQSIGERYSAAGGSTTHLPAIATPLGDANKVTSPQAKAKGVDSPSFKETKADQKVNEPGVVGKDFYNAQYGTEKGK